MTNKPTPVSLSRQLHALVLIIGAAVGAGMFSLPTIAAGMWFWWALLALLLVGAVMLLSGLLLLETNLRFEPGASFHTLVTALLGPRWSLVNSLALVFILYILTYAFISGGSAIVNYTLEAVSLAPVSAPAAVVMFVLPLALFVWLSTAAVGRLTSVLLVGMAISLFMTGAGLLPGVTAGHLEPPRLDGRWIYLFAALPYFTAAFGYHSLVPSLVKYLGKRPAVIARILGLGCLLVFGIYALWLLMSQGVLGREGLADVARAGGNVDALLQGLAGVRDVPGLADLLGLFANCALVSSFLGVTLSLFDFLLDTLKLEDHGRGRAIAALITFLPPTLAAILAPEGFLYAIGYAGFALAFCVLIVPALAARRSRLEGPATGYRAPLGDVGIYLVLAAGVLVAGFHITAKLGLLPVYP